MDLMSLKLHEVLICKAWRKIEYVAHSNMKHANHTSEPPVKHSKYQPFDIGWERDLCNDITLANSTYWMSYYGEEKYKEIVDSTY
jgi:hypothetical protein